MKQRLMLISIYTLMEFGTNIFLRLVSTIILSRLLEPSVFGVFAVIAMIVMIINTFTDVGFRPIALSREGGLTHEFLQSMQTAQMMRGTLLMTIMAIVSCVVYFMQIRGQFLEESAYADPELPFLMLGMSLTFAVSSMSSANALLYDKKLNHDLMFRFSMFFSILSGISPVVSVYLTGSIWGLVISSVLIAMARATFSWVVFKGAAFRIRFVREDLLLFLHRGKWIMSQTFLGALGTTADRVLFGLMFTDARFGLYYLATQISRAVEQLLRRFENKIGIQLFTEMENDTSEAFQKKYYRLRMPYDFVGLTTSGFLVAFAPVLIDIIYEDRYSEVADFIQILAFATIFVGPGLIRQAFHANREFKLTTSMMLARTVFLWSGLTFAIVGLDSVMIAIGLVACQRLPEVLMMLYIGRQRGWVNLWKEVRMLPCILLGMAAGYSAGQGYYWLITSV